jgi:putative NADH-flavin reductase
MKLALIGATGQVGSRVLAEALRRGHEVAAFVRDIAKLAARPRLTVKRVDATNTDELAAALQGYEVLLSSYAPARGISNYAQTALDGYQSIVAAAKVSHVRLLAVGGAGSLLLPDGTALVDGPHFPPEFKTEASTYRDILNRLRQEKELNWTVLSPAAYLMPGERTGQFRLGGDSFLTDASGQSRISMEDYAIALLDEVEHPKHPRQRFSVAY